jgi:hypothetical protein
MIRSALRINETKQINGSHSLLLISFVGITTWLGRFSITPSNIVPKALNGVARFAFWNEI